MRLHRQRSSPGFTIMEMLIVLSIVLLLCGMGTIVISAAAPDPVRMSAEILKSNLSQARSLAEKSGINHSVTFNNYNTSIRPSSGWSSWGNAQGAFSVADPFGNLALTDPSNPAYIFDPDHQWYAIIREQLGFDLDGDGDPSNDIYSNPAVFERALVGGKQSLESGVAFSGLTYRDGRIRNNNTNCFFSFDTTRADKIPTPNWTMLTDGTRGNIRYQFTPDRRAFFYRPDYSSGLPGQGVKLPSKFGRRSKVNTSETEFEFAQTYGRFINGNVYSGGQWSAAVEGSSNPFWPVTEAKYSGINYHPVCWLPSLHWYKIGANNIDYQTNYGLFEYQSIGLFQPGLTVEEQPELWSVEVYSVGGLSRLVDYDLEDVQQPFDIECF